jgi:hypothetical protein
MSTLAWTVDVDGAEHRINIETDAQSGRTAIRVDGKIAGRPMLPGEEEREFHVGRGVYILRRMEDGSFDLDVGMPDPIVQETRKKPPASNQRRAITAVFVAAMAGILWWGWVASAYLRISWFDWSLPSAGVAMEFPAEPEDVTRKQGEGEAEKVIPSFRARYRDHTYVLEQYDLQAPMTEAASLGLVRQSVKEAWPDGDVQFSDTRVSSRDAVQYLVSLPAADNQPAVTLRGIGAVHATHMYFAWVQTPPGEAQTIEVPHFLHSIKLPRDFAFVGNPSHNAAAAFVAQSQKEAMREMQLSSWLMQMIARVGGLALAVVIIYVWLIRR